MDATTDTTPVRHFVIDGFVEPREWWEAPKPDWISWEARYDNELERGKRTTRTVHGWSEGVLRRMHEIDVLRACSQLFGIAAYPDAMLWGGGLHVLSPNGHLATHLDGVLHPQRPYIRRAVQLVCFCTWKWKPEYGGRFYFADPLGEVVKRIDPLPGRLLAFETTDLAYHGVEKVAADAPERLTVTSSLLAQARESDTRKRALFMPPR